MASVPTALALPALSTRHPRRRRHLLLRPCSLSSSAASSSSSVPLLGSLAPKSRSVCRYAGNYEKDFHSDHKGSNKMGSDLIEIESISYLMEEEDVLINMIPKRASLGRVTNPKFDIFNGLKFAVLSGLLTFQGCQHATAITEIASGLQPASFIGDLGDIGTGFTSAFLLIFFSELGDKTFFIAALLAARNSALVVFLGTFGALGVMTIISVILGRTFHYVDDILPFRFGETDLPVDDVAAVCLLVYFGVSTLIDASSSDGSKAQGEKEEAELAIADVSGSGAGIVAAASTVISTFALVFVAEWGDKSFFSTIALAAASSPLGVVGGALAGHAAATLLAVVGGSLLGTFFSEKVIAYVGGLLFLVFAAVTLSGIVS